VTLFERNDALATLTTQVVRIRNGAPGGVVYLEGAFGTGKSSLLQAWVDEERARRTPLLHARGGAGQNLGFDVVRQLFEPFVVGQIDAVRLASGAVNTARSARSTGPAYPWQTSEPQAEALDGLYRLAVQTADGKPLVLVVDDVHRADALSLRFLDYLRSRLERLPILLVVSTRTGESRLREDPLAALRSDPDTVAVTIGPLRYHSVAAWVREVFADRANDDFCTACYQASLGNPLLLRELLAGLVAAGAPPKSGAVDRIHQAGAPSIGARVLGQLTAGAPHTRAVIEALAVLGDQTPVPLVAALAGLDVSAAVDPIMYLRRNGVLAVAGERLPDGMTLAFAYPLIRSAVLGMLAAAGTIGQTHRRAAEIMSSVDAPPEQVASHLMQTAPAGDSATAYALRVAADSAIARGARDVAAEFLRRALQELSGGQQRAAVLRELGSVEMFSAPQAAVRRFREAMPVLPPLDRGEVAGMLAMALSLEGRGVDAVFTLAEEIARLRADGSAGDPALQDSAMVLEAHLIHIAYDSPSTVRAAVHRAEAVTKDLQGVTRGERALLTALAIHGMAGHAPARRTLEWSLLAYQDGYPLDGPTAAVLPMALFAPCLADALDVADRGFREFTVWAARHPSPYALTVAALGRCTVALLNGSTTHCVNEARNALALPSVRASGFAGPLADLAATALMQQGNLADAREMLRQHTYLASPSRTRQRAQRLFTQGGLLLAEAEFADALEDLLECGRHLTALGITNPALNPWRSEAAFAHLALGQQSQARELAAAELQGARRWGTPRAIGRSLHASGRAEGGAQGVELLVEAVAQLERSAGRLELALALNDLGHAHHAAGRRVDAGCAFVRAHELAEQCGAPVVARKARSGMALSGISAGQTSPDSSLCRLSMRERDIATLATNGLSNREIAERMVLTLRNVERTLGVVYRKLEIAGRRGLAEALRAVQAENET
jgi:DNA-binding CsgD family transcriptional regulator